jgi:glycosyltransferase involved in cell wall biosynthesis
MIGIMAFSLSQVLIVIPAFNESETIQDVILETRECLPEATIIVVNDGSTDNTAAIARQNGALVADLPCNLGVGGAVRCGLLYAVQNNFPVAVQVDADGQHNPESVKKLLSLLRDGTAVDVKADADLVIGARFAGIGDYVVKGPRKWVMIFLAAILSKTVGTKLTDTTSGLKAHGPDALKVFSRDYPVEYLGDTIEALVIGSKSGLNIRQTPVIMRERAGGIPSHKPLKSAVYLARAFLALLIAYLRPVKQSQLS